MNEEKFGQFIKDIRKKNNLTQREFAEKFGVTYQAVSKWENGINMPDLMILKDICKEYNMSIDEFLGNIPSTPQKKKIDTKVFVLIGIFLTILITSLIVIRNHSNNGFEHKLLSSSCDSYNLNGSIAYNKNKTSIYISHISYCGKEDNTLYKNVSVSLYEQEGNKITKIDTQEYKEENLSTIKNLIKDITFNVNNFEKTCKYYNEHSLYIQIDALTEDDEIYTHKIPLNIDDNC